MQQPEPIFKINSINSVEISAKEDESLIQVNDQQKEATASKLEQSKNLKIEEERSEEAGETEAQVERSQQRLLSSQTSHHRDNKSIVSPSSTSILAKSKKFL